MLIATELHQNTKKALSLYERKMLKAVLRDRPEWHFLKTSFSGSIPIKSTITVCLLYTSPSPRDQRGSRMPSSA